MLRFDTATVVTSNPFNVNRQAVSSHNREMLGDMCDRGRWASPVRPRWTMGPLRPPSLGAPWGRTRSLEGERMYPWRAL